MDADEQWLHKGWDWLDRNQNDPRYREIEETWMDRLRRYEETYRLAYPERYAGYVEIIV